MKKILVFVITLGLIASSAWAKPGSSSGGGRSYSGGSNGGGRSFSGSGGSSSKPPSYSSSPSSGKTYSGGSSSKPTVSPPSSGGKTYSGGSSSGSSTSSHSGSSSTSSTSSKPPTKVTYDNAAIKDHKTVESRQTYKASFQKGDTAKTEYKDSKGNSVKIDPKDKKIESLRNQLSDEKWSNRELRERNFYTSYYSRPPLFSPMVYYSDPYNPFFFLWLMDRSLEERSMWVYNHRSSLDENRYRDLLAKDTILAARLKELEMKNAAKDPTYAPKGIDPDLMYTDSYVDAAHNPHKMVESESTVGSILGGLCWGFVIILCLVLVAYLIFVHKW
jgi:hypothetical protein